ncbi:PREDICTED: uncharacterized protein LOC108563845 [Nicrophorus vespilloides]|uniref:Uncharacterized protein LOC108563845 n=1 Tax=Nicrophorus vespilloides TaxID=110193 RepID=A0ABM1MU81_NICVS|nr:PREDICTED: uncharacterized protein LOC108563845 [Nicrophorus vespilloides]
MDIFQVKTILFTVKSQRGFRLPANKEFPDITVTPKLNARYGTGACQVVNSSASFVQMEPFSTNLQESAIGGSTLTVHQHQTTTTSTKTFIRFPITTPINNDVNGHAVYF